MLERDALCGSMPGATEVGLVTTVCTHPDLAAHAVTHSRQVSRLYKCPGKYSSICHLFASNQPPGRFGPVSRAYGGAMDPRLSGAVLAVVTGLLGVPAAAKAQTPPIQLPQTGQVTCWRVLQDSSVVPTTCSNPQDGDLRAGAPLPEPRFTDRGDGTVTDNLTGLMWTQDANLPGALLAKTDVAAYVAGMNAGTYPNLGYTDWRVPDRTELLSLID